MPKFKIIGTITTPISLEIEAPDYDAAHELACQADNWDEKERDSDIHWEYTPPGSTT